MTLRIYNGHETKSDTSDRQRGSRKHRQNLNSIGDRYIVLALPVDYLVNREGKISRKGRENLKMFAEIASANHCEVVFETNNLRNLHKIMALIDFLHQEESVGEKPVGVVRLKVVASASDLQSDYVRTVFNRIASPISRGKSA